MLRAPVKVVDIELSQPLRSLSGLERYSSVQALVRLHGRPIGYVKIPIVNGCCAAKEISGQILKHQARPVIYEALSNAVAQGISPEGIDLDSLLDTPPPEAKSPIPSMTVAVCTRDRTEALALCLKSLAQLDYPGLEVLIVDNAPASDATERLVREKYPQFRYVSEPRPGLNWARNRAALEASGEIIAYTDDDAAVGATWTKALAANFSEDPTVMAVTGLIVPFELETQAQVLFEEHDSFHTSFSKQWFSYARGSRLPWHMFGAVQCGAGANMAFRRAVFHQIGYFDTALDAGTPSKAGGDLEMFFRILKEGHTLVYEPGAVVRHRHRSTYAELKTQLRNNATGLLASCVRCTSAYPDERLSFLRQAVHWTWHWHFSKIARSFLKPTFFPHDLLFADLKGCIAGLAIYRKAQKQNNKITSEFGELKLGAESPAAESSYSHSKDASAVAVRRVELTQPLQPLTDLGDYESVRVFACWQGSPLGIVDVWNKRQPISVSRLSRSIADTLTTKLIEPSSNLNDKMRWAKVIAALSERLLPRDEKTSAPVEKLPDHIPITIIVGTYDRPEDLRKCLQGLVAQPTARPVEIIIVDNHPASGLTPPVVKEFPKVLLVNEPRAGVAYARNAGIVASSGEIIVTTDDDVAMSPDWLEKLLTPFARTDVVSVTGNVLPVEMETYSQYIFEQYGEGGLGRGFERWTADAEWFDSARSWAVPTWLLGATSNSAFRAEVFHDSEIGLMDEALGPGMPSGVGEDIYLFYKILKAGHSIVYEPAACVWHTHRRTMKALRRQLYNYSKGCVCYQLTTLLHDGDCRALRNMVFDLPVWHARRIAERLLRKSPYPITLIFVEMAGHLAGPWTLLRSRLRVRREGRSRPYLPPSQREPVHHTAHLCNASLAAPHLTSTSEPAPTKSVSSAT